MRILYTGITLRWKIFSQIPGNLNGKIVQKFVEIFCNRSFHNFKHWQKFAKKISRKQIPAYRSCSTVTRCKYNQHTRRLRTGTLCVRQSDDTFLSPPPAWWVTLLRLPTFDSAFQLNLCDSTCERRKPIDVVTIRRAEGGPGPTSQWQADDELWPESIYSSRTFTSPPVGL